MIITLISFVHFQLAARQAERDLKEAKNESAVLRQKLTEMERERDSLGLIRPLPTRGMPPMMNGPPPPPLMPGERPGSRGSGMPPSPLMR